VVKGVTFRSRHVRMRETSVNEPLMTHRNSSDDIETGERLCPGNSMAETYVPAMWCPVYRRRDSHSGFRTELENLAGDGKGKGASGETARLKVPMHWPGADCSVVARKRGNSRGAKGAGHSRHNRLGQLATGGTEWLWRRAAALTEWHEPCDGRLSCTDL